MPDRHYTDPRLAALYDLGNGWSEDRDFYLGLAASGTLDILDLGCGTGLLCGAYAARGHRVVGLDPAPAMLEVARATYGDAVTWVLGGAEAMDLGRRFDLVIMTGHAFQVLLTEDDLDRVLANVHAHLCPGGRFVFESRNPKIAWETRWDTSSTLETTDGRIQEERKIVSRTPEQIVFETHYQWPDGDALVSSSTLRFFTLGELKRALRARGLDVVRVLGDWQGAPWDEETSDEIIIEARRPHARVP